MHGLYNNDNNTSTDNNNNNKILIIVTKHGLLGIHHGHTRPISNVLSASGDDDNLFYRGELWRAAKLRMWMLRRTFPSGRGRVKLVWPR